MSQKVSRQARIMYILEVYSLMALEWRWAVMVLRALWVVPSSLYFTTSKQSRFPCPEQSPIVAYTLLHASCITMQLTLYGACALHGLAGHINSRLALYTEQAHNIQNTVAFYEYN